jgi:hypothetical protein
VNYELIHASVPRGLRDQRGFCIAAMTRGMPEELLPVLEGLSAYDVDESALGADRTEWAFRFVTTQGRVRAVLTRVVPCHHEWRGRTNRVAHHIVVAEEGRAVAGPAWVLFTHRGFESLPPTIEERATGPVLPNGNCPPRRATEWENEGFHPGWAGVVAQTIVEAEMGTVYLAFDKPANVLPLLVDVFSLLPEDIRWKTTFSTRFGSTAGHVRCQVRCVLAERAEAGRLLDERGARVVRLDRAAPPPPGDAARAALEGWAIPQPARTTGTTRPAIVVPASKPPIRATDFKPPPSTGRRAPTSEGSEFELLPEPRELRKPDRLPLKPGIIDRALPSVPTADLPAVPPAQATYAPPPATAPGDSEDEGGIWITTGHEGQDSERAWRESPDDPPALPDYVSPPSGASGPLVVPLFAVAALILLVAAAVAALKFL